MLTHTDRPSGRWVLAGAALVTAAAAALALLWRTRLDDPVVIGLIALLWLVAVAVLLLASLWRRAPVSVPWSAQLPPVQTVVAELPEGLSGTLQQLDQLRRSLAMLQSDMARIADEVPRHEGRVAEASGALAALSDRAQAQIDALGRASDDMAARQAAMVGQLDELHGKTEALSLRMAEAQADTSRAIDALLDRTAHAGDMAREVAQAHSASILAMLDQSRHAVDEVGARSQAALVDQIRTTGARLDEIRALSAGEIEGLQAMIDRLIDGLGMVDARLATLESRLDGRNADATNAVEAIARHEGVLSSIADLPQTLEQAVPIAAALSGHVGQASERLTDTGRQLVEVTQHADSLRTTVAQADEAALALSEVSGARLVEALLRVRETAMVAGERARETIGLVIPDAAQRLGEELDRTINERLMALRHDSIDAVAAAEEATAALGSQIATLAERARDLEGAARAAAEQLAQDDRDTIARRVSFLIESLNSLSIDVAKMMSEETSDRSWAEYLKGDRAVFTRRAARLIGNEDAARVRAHYGNDPAFRDQVNRYIHDFEAMLRQTMASRDGTPLSVTLLSSDMGKLYVALAQAVERLR